LIQILIACFGLLSSQVTFAADTLPEAVRAEMGRLKIPMESLSVLVLKKEGLQTLISFNPSTPRNPASLMKLVTTSAAMDLLGPAFTWTTQVYIDGPIEEGILKGNLYIKGQGDPHFGVERLWLLMRRVKGLGIKSITGDIVMDHKSFEPILQDAGDFDGEPLRPYNASPDALLINFKSLLISFVPDLQAKLVRIHLEPPLQGLNAQETAPLISGDCLDYRAGLRASFQDPNVITFRGGYPQSCGERLWPIAYVDPSSFADKAIAAMWGQVGGSLAGKVRFGEAPRNQKPIFSLESPQLAEVIREINKFSNNVMAQQLFLTMGMTFKNSGSPEASLGVLNKWWTEKLSGPIPTFVNGSGLSRDTRMSADDLAKLLVWDLAQPTYPELASSLPLVGVDGTLKQSKAKTHGHLKTGSLKDVLAIAGYLQNKKNQQLIIVAIINHPQAQSAKPVLDALIDWVGDH